MAYLWDCVEHCVEPSRGDHGDMQETLAAHTGVPIKLKGDNDVHTKSLELPSLPMRCALGGMSMA